MDLVLLKGKPTPRRHADVYSTFRQTQSLGARVRGSWGPGAPRNGRLGDWPQIDVSDR